MMNATVKAEWIAALRSGNYKQCKSLLHTNSGFCCLGVLCDIYLRSTGGVWEGDSTGMYCLGHQDLLPPAVQRYAGLDDKRCTYGPSKTDYLTYDNDYRGKSFGDIADIIEQCF